MLILKFRKYNNSLYKLSSDFQIVTVLGLQFIIFILQQLHNLITTALVASIKVMMEGPLPSICLCENISEETNVGLCLRTGWCGLALTVLMCGCGL